MRSIARRLVHFLRDDEAVTAVECALMLALVVVVCIVAINPANPAPAAGDPVVVQISRNN